MTDTPAGWEPEQDVSDTDAIASPEPEPPTPQPEPPDPPPHMKYDDSTGKLTEAEPQSSREAKYRQALRAVESERDRLRDQLDARIRSDVEHLVGNRLIDPADLWAGGVTVADVTDPESGELSTDLIDEAVARVLKLHPHWHHSAAAPASQVTSQHGGVTAEEPPTWQQLFQASTRPQ